MADGDERETGRDACELQDGLGLDTIETGDLEYSPSEPTEKRGRGRGRKPKAESGAAVGVQSGAGVEKEGNKISLTAKGFSPTNTRNTRPCCDGYRTAYFRTFR